MTLETMTLGALLGYLAGSAPSPEVINDLIEKKPEFYDIVDIDLSTARDNQEYTKSGTFIWIDNQFARGSVTLRLNEPAFKQLDLRRQRYISGPFYRFFITNVAGQGVIKLFISRGYQAASEPIEAINMAELAARLGSIATFDRRGDIMFLDSFEGGIDKWSQTPLGTDSAIAWSADAARNGAFSCKMTTGNATDDSTTILHYLPYPVTSRVGFEISFVIDNDLSNLIFSQRLYDGSYEHWGRLRYLPATDKLQYLDKDAAWQDLETLVLLAAGYIFHTIKLVLDLSTHKYVRAILNDVEYDMSALSYRHTADPDTTPHWEQMADIITGVNANISNYVDDAIVTQNEP